MLSMDPAGAACEGPRGHCNGEEVLISARCTYIYPKTRIWILGTVVPRFSTSSLPDQASQTIGSISTSLEEVTIMAIPFRVIMCNIFRKSWIRGSEIHCSQGRCVCAWWRRWPRGSTKLSTIASREGIAVSAASTIAIQSLRGGLRR